MNFGENVYHAVGGFVYGVDTDRLIAEFSHESEAESFVDSYNAQYDDERVIYE